MQSFACRQIDKYDGQFIFCGNKVVYDLGNYLGGGASGSVYQATDCLSHTEKSVAIKILNPLSYKNVVVGQLNKCSVAVKGLPLTAEQAHSKSPFQMENVWWLLHPVTKMIFAAYEDPVRQQLRELPLPKCIEIWGLNPMQFDTATESELEKLNVTSTVHIENILVRIPVVSPKYLKFLRSRQSVCREMSNMIQIGEHPNIVDLLEVLELIQDTKTTLFLVLELVSGGELFERMKGTGSGGNYSEEFARRYFTQLLSGIEYCHQRGVVHRDLKPENLLLSDPSDAAILKIADFGLSAIISASETLTTDTCGILHQESKDSKVQCVAASGGASQGGGSIFITPTKQILSSMSVVSLGPAMVDAPTSSTSLRRLKSVVGSPHYIAPEVTSNDPSGYDGRKVDMWSAGVILYSLLTGMLPFGGDIALCPRFKRYKQWLTTEVIVTAAKEGKELWLPAWFWPAGQSSLAGSLLIGLLHLDPAHRLTAKEATKHPWCQQQGVTDARVMPQTVHSLGPEKKLFGSNDVRFAKRSSPPSSRRLAANGKSSPVEEGVTGITSASQKADT